MDFKELLEQILNPDNTEPITLYNEADEPAKFAQLAFIPHKDNYYVVLTPDEPIEGVDENAVMIFKIDEEEECIALEENEELATEVFDIFIEMCQEAEEEEENN